MLRLYLRKPLRNEYNLSCCCYDSSNQAQKSGLLQRLGRFFRHLQATNALLHRWAFGGHVFTGFHLEHIGGALQLGGVELHAVGTGSKFTTNGRLVGQRVHAAVEAAAISLVRLRRAQAHRHQEAA